MSKKIPIPSRDDLLAQYTIPGCTLSSLARHYFTSNPTVRSWLLHHHIPLKSHKQASQEANMRQRLNPPPKHELELSYRSLSLKAMEEKYAVGQATIYEWLFSYNIPTRSHMQGCAIRSYATSKTSKWENDLFQYLLSIDPDGEWKQNDRLLIAPKELDIVSYKRRLAIECCGVYWHSELFGRKSPQYHTHKTELTRKRGFSLLTLFDTDVEAHYKTLIKYKLQKMPKIGARTCTVERIQSTEANKFHMAHHAAGWSRGSSHHYGLFDHNHILRQVLSLGQSRFHSSTQWEIHRFTNNPTYSVAGGLSKLWKCFVEEQQPHTAVTYADLRFGVGKGYEHIGFVFSHYSQPNYWYFETKTGGTVLHSRVAFQKHKLATKLPQFDPTKTEWENMQANGYDRIWDCGNAVYVWNKNCLDTNTYV